MRACFARGRDTYTFACAFVGDAEEDFNFPCVLVEDVWEDTLSHVFLWKTLKLIRNIPYIILLLPLSVFHKNTMVSVSSSASSTKTQWFAASSSTSSTKTHARGLLP